jgi:putative nucleotidyltransferase with HDIG domain
MGRRLPSLPANVTRILDLLDSRTATTETIAAAIGEDQSLAGQVLRLVNSGFYGLRQCVSSVSQATVLLGVAATRNVVLSSFVDGLLAGASPGLHVHALAVSRACSVLCRELGIPDAGTAATVGLLHDVGKGILAGFFPEDYERVQALALADGCLFIDAEQRALNTDHTELGRSLLESWNLPEHVVVPVARHHDCEPAHEYDTGTALVHVADVLVRAEGIGDPGDRRIPRLNAYALGLLGIRKPDLKPLMDAVVDQLSDLSRSPVHGSPEAMPTQYPQTPARDRPGK